MHRAVLMLAFTVPAAGRWALRQLDGPRPGQPSQVLKWCSPFTSGRVLEGVYEAALAGASPAQALRALAGEHVFAEWARARAYDAVHRGQADPDLAAAADPGTLRTIVSSEPPHAEGCRSYCPRCAATWIEPREACPECEVPAVLTGHTAVRPRVHSGD